MLQPGESVWEAAAAALKKAEPRKIAVNSGLAPVTDGLSWTQRRELEKALGQAYHFYVASEGGLHSVEVAGRTHYFARTWAVIRAPVGEAWGGSGSIQLPEHLVDGMDAGRVPYAFPGRRRSGGMVASLTGGMETRRSSVATATLHALSTLFYGMLESHPGSRRYHTTL